MENRYLFKNWTGSQSVKFILLLGALILACGCSYPISKPVREQAKKDLTYSVIAVSPDQFIGDTVILGGIINSIENQPRISQLEIINIPLDSEGMPGNPRRSSGGFIARTVEYLDPEIYQRGRKVTIAGKIQGSVKRKVGKSEQVFPILEIRELHLWETQYRQPMLYYGKDNFYDPYHWPYWEDFLGRPWE